MIASPRSRRTGLRLQRSILACFALLAIPLAGCGERSDNRKDEVGGVEHVPTDGEMVLEAANFAVDALVRDGARLARVIRAEHQVVAGLKYYLEIELTDGTVWEVTVLYTPEGEWELTKSRQLE